MSEGWKYLLANSFDLSVIGEIRSAHDRKLSVDLTKTGSADCWMPIQDRLSGEVVPWKTCIIAQHDNDYFWSGPVKSRSADLANGRVTISAVSWFERFSGLLLTEQSMITPYVNQDAGNIISLLVDIARSIDSSLPISMGLVVPSQIRTITYSIDQSIGQAIQQLVDLESGVDWYIDPTTRQMNIVPRLGTNREKVKWLFIGDGKSKQSNLSNCVENVDGSTVVNDFRARGKYATGYHDDPLSKSQYGVFQESQSLSDVTDTNVLVAYAGAEIFYRAQPRTTYTLSPKSSSKLTVPKLFRDFDIGDTTYLTARRGFVNIIDQPVRIFGASLDIRNDGSEQITNLQITA